MLKKLTKLTTAILAVGLVVFSCMCLVAHAASPPAPAFTSATYDAASGALVITGTNMVAVTGSSNDIQLSKVTITDGVNHSFTLKSKGEITSASSATIVLSAAEQAGLGAFLDKAGTKALNDGNYQINVYAGWNGSTSATDLGSHPLTVSHIAGLLDATYDVATGKLVITGSYIASVAGTKNDVLPKYITITDGDSFSYTLTTGGVELDGTTRVTIPLNAADQIALQYMINKNGTETVENNDYQFTAAYGWNGPQLAQMKFYPITISNYALPVVSIRTSSITLGSNITPSSTGLSVTKPGYVYIIPEATDISHATKADLDTLVTGGVALKGAVPVPSKASIATSGKTITFTLTEASADFKVVAVDYAGALSQLSDNTLTINNVPAPALSATAVPGSAVDSTRAVATAGSGDTLAIKLSATTIAAPKLYERVEGLTAYTTGTDITGASPTNKYLGVYELSGESKVVKFKLIILAPASIKAPAFKSASVSDKTLTLVTDTLSTSSVPAVKAFTVKSAGSANAVTKVQIAEDGKSVILTLTRSVAYGQTVTVAYTKPTTNYLQNAAGNAINNLASTVLTVTVIAPAPPITGASIGDKPGDFDGVGLITLPAAGSGDTYAYFIPDSSYTMPVLGADVSSWTAVEDGDSITLGDNASEANGTHVLVAEVDSHNHVVKASDITASGIEDYVPDEPEEPVAAPAISGASISDKTGETNNGRGVINLPAATGDDTYVYKMPVGDYSLPFLGDDVSSWAPTYDGAVLILGENAAAVNGLHLLVAEVDGSNKVVKVSDITISGIKDYIEATNGILIGAVDFADDQTVADVIDGTERTFTITVDGGDPIDITIASDVATLEDLAQSIADQVAAADSDATVMIDLVDSKMVIVISSETTGAASTIVAGGDDWELFFGASPTVYNGADAQY